MPPAGTAGSRSIRRGGRATARTCSTARSPTTVDGGRTWENLSEGFPGVSVRGLEVSPTTGDVFTGFSNGSRVLPPPYRETSAAARSTAPSVWGQRFLDRPY